MNIGERDRSTMCLERSSVDSTGEEHPFQSLLLRMLLPSSRLRVVPRTIPKGQIQASDGVFDSGSTGDWPGAKDATRRRAAVVRQF
jgi:hypothetical protein